MTVSFLDGPAAGRALMLRRAPLYLRVVHNPAAPAHNERVRYKRDRIPEWDALDQLDDQHRDGETIHVYRRVRDLGPVFVRPGGRYRMAEYRHVPVTEREISDDGLMHNFFWQLWVERRVREQANRDPGERNDDAPTTDGEQPAAGDRPGL